MQRADFNADFVATNGGNNGLHRFQGKARLVFDAAAVFVVALVAGIGEELLRQVAIGGVEFDAIESGFDGIFCRSGVIGNDLPDFGAREFTRGQVSAVWAGNLKGTAGASDYRPRAQSCQNRRLKFSPRPCNGGSANTTPATKPCSMPSALPSPAKCSPTPQWKTAKSPFISTLTKPILSTVSLSGKQAKRRTNGGRRSGRKPSKALRD